MGTTNFTPNPDTQWVPPDLGFMSTTLAAAQQNILAGTEQAVGQMNLTLKTAYLNQFAAFAADVINGRSKPENAPQPPIGFVVGFKTEEANPNIKWAYPAVGNLPVCAMPPLPTPPQASGPVGDIQSTNGYRNCPPDDTFPVGWILTDPNNGDQWQKQTSNSPFGIRHFYALVASTHTPDLVRPKITV